MIFYHGLTKEKWEKTLQQGYLLHDRKSTNNPNAEPVTYLATNIEEAKMYGEVLLEVDYNPFINTTYNNYVEGCWQIRVYEPIPLSKITKL